MALIVYNKFGGSQTGDQNPLAQATNPYIPESENKIDPTGLVEPEGEIKIFNGEGPGIEP
jgi:hypothetical protein